MVNCWLKRTPLEAGLILILIVAVPFLITLIVAYAVLLIHNCPNCSESCKQFCKNATLSKADVIPMFAQLNPNISVWKLAHKYAICPDSLLRNFQDDVDYKFVASILRDVYIDDVLDQQYVAAAAIISFHWVVTSSKYVRAYNQIYKINGLFVRAGSNYWSKQGSVHSVKRVVYADSNSSATVAALELQVSFPKLPTIRPIMLAKTSLYEELAVAESYGWLLNYMAPLKLRKKFEKMWKVPMVVFKNPDCDRLTGHQTHVFCASTVREDQSGCPDYTGFPVTKARILMGVDIEGYCDEDQKTTIHLIYDINNAMEWLESLTGVYAENT